MLSMIGLLISVIRIYISYRLLRTTFAFLRALFIYRIAPLFYQPNIDPFKDRWTVVTGGTDGIGKAYIIELAKRGIKKFVLIGRNEKKLQCVKSFLEETFTANVKTVLFDFCESPFENLKGDLDNLDIGFVVNSVGIGRELLERYGDNPVSDRNILKVNGINSAEFLSIVLPIMEQNGGGQIICISSFLCFRPMAYLASYSAAKSLITFLCDCIDREYKTINVQCLTPGVVATKMTFYEKPNYLVVSPEDLAAEAVSTIGLTNSTSGCLKHEIQLLIRHLFPWTVLKHMLRPIYWHQRHRVLQLYRSRHEKTNGDIH